MTWTDEESKEREEPLNDVMVLVSLKTIKDPPTNAVENVVSSPRAVAEGSDDEEISDEEMVHSYRVMYKKLVKALNENQDLRKQFSLLSNEKEDLVKRTTMLQDKVS